MIVITCTDHPYWAQMRFHRDEAHTAACTHEAREHPGDYTQRNAQQMRTRRVESVTSGRLCNTPEKV